LDRRNKPWSFMSIGRPMDLTQLLDLTVPIGTGRQKQELVLMTKESPEPLSVKYLMPKVPTWIL
jgi:hypothetical protein